MLHLMAKRIIKETGWLPAPEFDQAPQLADMSGQIHIGERITKPGGTLRFDALVEEAPLFGYKADLLGVKGDAKLAIEVVVTHPVDAAKSQKLTAMNVSIIEINLGYLNKLEFLSLEEVRQAIYGKQSQIKWINYAPAREEVEIAKDELERKVNSINEEIKEKIYSESVVRDALEQLSMLRGPVTNSIERSLNKPEQLFSLTASDQEIEEGVARLGFTREHVEQLYGGCIAFDVAAGYEMAWIWRSAVLAFIERQGSGHVFSNKLVFEAAVNALPFDNELRKVTECSKLALQRIAEVGKQGSCSVPEWSRRPHVVISEYIQHLKRVGVLVDRAGSLVVSVSPRELGKIIAENNVRAEKHRLKRAEEAENARLQRAAEDARRREQLVCEAKRVQLVIQKLLEGQRGVQYTPAINALFSVTKAAGLLIDPDRQLRVGNWHHKWDKAYREELGEANKVQPPDQDPEAWVAMHKMVSKFPAIFGNEATHPI